MPQLTSPQPRTRMLPGHLQLPPALEQLLENLDAFDGLLDPDRVPAMLAEMRLSPAEAQRLCLFDDASYVRTICRRTEHYETVLIAWGPGQISPRHDHGRSECGVRVVAGEAIETLYDPDPEAASDSSPRWVERCTCRHPAGCVMLAEHGVAHRMGCAADADEPLITLHVYSPPLLPSGVLGALA